jgi:transcriptional regulator with XRE-family HTH domain
MHEPQPHFDTSARPDESATIRVAVAENMRRARLARGMSLRELAAETGLSKALLSQLERQVANPTVSTLTRIAATLEIGFSELIKSAQPEPLVIRGVEAPNGDTKSRMLFTMMERHRFDISEGFLKAGDHGVMSDHGRGSIEYGYVVCGEVELTIEGETYLLRAGDAIQFSAAHAHAYDSPTHDSTLLTVVAYTDD